MDLGVASVLVPWHRCVLKLDWADRAELKDPALRFIITGATGWLGRVTAELLLRALGQDFGKRVTLCASRAGAIRLSDGVPRLLMALDEVPQASVGPAQCIVFHYAFLTKDRVEGLDRDQYIAQNRRISESVASILGRNSVRGLILASSGAVYDHLRSGRGDESARLYGQLKAEDEERFGALCASAGTRLVAPRLFNLSGPYINKFEKYALSAIIADVLARRPVTLHAKKRVFRSYCYIEDILDLCIRLVFQATAEQAVFDTVGDEIVEVGVLAERVLRVMGGAPLEITRPVLENVPDDYYVGDSSLFPRLMSTLGCVPTGLNEQIERTAHYMKMVQGSACHSQ